MSTGEFDPKNTRQRINPADMPSLDDTAEVPMVNSDKVNSPDYWNTKMENPSQIPPREHRDEKKSFGKKIAAGVAGAALLGGGLFAGTKLAGGEDSPEGPSNTGTVATATETPGSSAAEPTSEPSPDVSSPTERPFTSDWYPSPIVDILDQANATEFEQYPTQDRVQFIIEAENWYAGANVTFEYDDQRLPGINKYGEDKTLGDHNYMFNPQTKTTSAETIIMHQVYVDQLMSAVDEHHLATEDFAHDTTVIDTDLARKLASGIYADPDSRSYRLLSDSREDYPEKGRIKDELVTSIRVNSSSPNYDKKDFEGNIRLHKDINYSDANGTYNITVAAFPVKNPVKSTVGEDLSSENVLWLTTYDEAWDSQTN